MVGVIKRLKHKASFCHVYNYTLISLLSKAIPIQHVMRGESNHYISPTDRDRWSKSGRNESLE